MTAGRDQLFLMKTIIAGTRTVDDYDIVKEALSRIDWEITEVVSGCAKGVDTFALRWAYDSDVPTKKFPADWDTHGKAAGPIRNREMAKYADAAVIIWDGKSKGTANMLEEARKAGLTKIALFYENELQASPIKKNPIFERHVAASKGSTDPREAKYKIPAMSEAEINGVTITFDPKFSSPSVAFIIEMKKEIDALKARVAELEAKM